MSLSLRNNFLYIKFQIMDNKNYYIVSWDDLIEVQLEKETQKMLIVKGYWKSQYNKNDLGIEIFETKEEWNKSIRDSLESRKAYYLREIERLNSLLEKKDFLKENDRDYKILLTWE